MTQERQTFKHKLFHRNYGEISWLQTAVIIEGVNIKKIIIKAIPLTFLMKI